MRRGRSRTSIACERNGARARRRARAAGAARECANVLKRNASPYRGEGLAVFGATPAPISRLRGRFRYQILMRAEKPGLMRHILAKSLDEWRDTSEHARVSLTIDVDPIDLL